MSTDDRPEPEDATDAQDAIRNFWTMTMRYARVGILDVYMGASWGAALAPPAWSFGDSPELADRLLGLVLDGRKRATTGLHQDYIDANEPLPRAGDLSIILDGTGYPQALIRDTEIVVAPFGEITAEQAAAEGEDDTSLDAWRAAHRAVWERHGQELSDDTPVVWERFEVLYPR